MQRGAPTLPQGTVVGGPAAKPLGCRADPLARSYGAGCAALAPSGCVTLSTADPEAVRAAIDLHIDARRNDKEFQARLTKLVEDNRRVLDRLAR